MLEERVPAVEQLEPPKTQVPEPEASTTGLGRLETVTTETAMSSDVEECAVTVTALVEETIA
jgi:hypothetical protein